MNNKYLQLTALKRIIDEKTPFQVVLEKTISQHNLSEEDKIVFNMDVLGSLRHFNYLRFEAITAFPEFQQDDDEIYLIVVALYELRYRSKDIARFQLIEQVMNTIDYMELRLDQNNVASRLEALAENKTPLPEPLKADPYAYNAMFFNTPEWLVRLWSKQYGDEQAMNIMIANQRRGPQFLAINTMFKKTEDYQEDDRLSVSNVVSSALEYRVGPCSSLQDVIDGDLFAQDLSYQILLEQLEFQYNQRILSLGSTSGSFDAGLAIRVTPFLGNVVSLFSDEKNFRRGKYLLARLGIKNVEAVHGGIDLMAAYFPYEGFDLVVFHSPSSRLGQVRRRPDLLITLKKEDIMDFASSASVELEEAAKHVAPQGVLLYCAPTLTREETTYVIKGFIAKNPNFVLDYQRTIFPNEYGSDGLYFAILKRI